MSYAPNPRRTSRNWAGIVFVVLLHAALIWALMQGLARKTVTVARAPIETRIIDEVKPPPPPPAHIELPPPPRFVPPPPVFVPPPEVTVKTPPPPQATITPTLQEPPPAPPPAPAPAPAPPAPPAPAPAAAPPAQPVSASVACSNYARVMGDAAFPREATRLGLDRGEVLVQFTLGPDGEIRDIKAVKATHAVFARAATRLVAAYKCAGQGRDVLVEVPFNYKVE